MTAITITNVVQTIAITADTGAVVAMNVLAVPAIVLSTVGIQGPPGSGGGGGGARYVHVQASAATLWTVAHNLGFRPVVAIYTVGGLEVAGGEVLHLSTLTLTITFDVAFAGSAALV